MILKGAARGSGQNLATHLMRLDDNEHVRLHELRGFAADDLAGAFREAEAVSLGTRCTQYLFSLSLNPPEASRLPEAAFEEAVDRSSKASALRGSRGRSCSTRRTAGVTPIAYGPGSMPTPSPPDRCRSSRTGRVEPAGRSV